MWCVCASLLGKRVEVRHQRFGVRATYIGFMAEFLLDAMMKFIAELQTCELWLLYIRNTSKLQFH